jgi:hypothetical protein
MVKLNLKKHIKGVAVSVKEAGKRRIQDYREERKEKHEARRQLKLAEREEYIKAKRDERDIHREEMLEEARERGRYVPFAITVAPPIPNPIVRQSLKRYNMAW